METTHEMLRMGEKNSHNQKQLWKDGIKLEPWIFKRMEQDLRETLLRSSNVENDDEKHHQNYWDTPEEWKAKRLSQQWNDLKEILEKHVTGEIHSYVTLEKNLE